MKPSLLCVSAVALGCAGKPPPPEPPPPKPALSAAEAARLPGCIAALEAANEQPEGAALIALACSPGCALEVPDSIRARPDTLIAFVTDRCARDAEPGQSMWHLADLGGDWIAGIYPRAKVSHPALAGRLDELFDVVSVPLPLEAEVRGLYDLPPAARATRPRTELFAVVTAGTIHVGTAAWAGFSARGARHKIGFGGAFPGERVRLDTVRATATRIHSAIADNPDATAADRAPLLLADRELELDRLRGVVERLGRARLGVELRGRAGEHAVQLTWVDRWQGTWLLDRPSRTLVRTPDQTFEVPHRGDSIDWSGVRAALARAGGGDLALDPPAEMTVRELTVVLDQIKTSDSDPLLFFAPAPPLSPLLAIEIRDFDGLAPDVIRRDLEGPRPALLACYQRALAADDRAEGAVEVRISVDRRGEVTASDVEATLGTEHAGCVESALAGLVFTRPRRRQAASFTAVLSFTAN